MEVLGYATPVCKPLPLLTKNRDGFWRKDKTEIGVEFWHVFFFYLSWGENSSYGNSKMRAEHAHDWEFCT